MKKASQASFETSYKRLEEIVSLLDAGKLSLDEMLALYEEGMKLAQTCEKQLEEAELKVNQLQVPTESSEEDAPGKLF